MIGYINGLYCKKEELKLSVMDLGLLRGYGVFEYFRTYQKRPFYLLSRLKRLEQSAKTIGISLPKSFEEIEEIIEHLLQFWEEKEATIRVIITGGISVDGLHLPKEPSLMIFLNYLPCYPQEFYQQGIAVLTTSQTRFLPQIKTLFYLPALTLLNEAKQKNAQDILYLNQYQEILEATTSNFFAIADNRLIISKTEDVLPGITRFVIKQLAQKKLMKIEERNLHLSEVDQIQEAFLTSSIREIIPIIKINQTIIHTGIPGPKTQELIKDFKEFVHS